MKTAKIKFEPTKNIKPYIEGDFEFIIEDKCIYSETELEPFKKISFWWSPEMYQDISMLNKDGDLYEMIAEKLKQDFLKLLNQNK